MRRDVLGQLWIDSAQKTKASSFLKGDPFLSWMFGSDDAGKRRECEKRKTASDGAIDQTTGSVWHKKNNREP